MKYKVGQFVEVIENTSSHEFAIGSVVKIKYIDRTKGEYTCESYNDYWYLGEEEIKPTEVKGFFTPQNV